MRCRALGAGQAPALAVDDGSLAADQRLRRQNVYFAVYPLVVLIATITTQGGLFGGGRHPRMDGLAAWYWSWVPLIAVLGIETIARELDKHDSSQQPRRRTWTPWEPSA